MMMYFLGHLAPSVGAGEYSMAGENLAVRFILAAALYPSHSTSYWPRHLTTSRGALN